MWNMWIQELKNLFSNWKQYNPNYQQKLMKEFFIKKALYYIYKISPYAWLTFNGWTCLKILYDLPRLSEDIDLDVLPGMDFDMKVFAEDILAYFKKYTQKDIQYSIKSMWKTLLIKIPILRDFNLGGSSESDFLYIKCDIQFCDWKNEDTQMTPYMKDGMFFMIKHYNLPTLFANKLRAVFGRWDKIYREQYSFKGRDFFDLIWYLQKKIKPNFEVIQVFLKEEMNISVADYDDLICELDKRINSIDNKWIYDDIADLVEDKVVASQFSDNFKQMYDNLKSVIVQ